MSWERFKLDAAKRLKYKGETCRANPENEYWWIRKKPEADLFGHSGESREPG
jgi:hypothetical protein